MVFEVVLSLEDLLLSVASCVPPLARSRSRSMLKQMPYKSAGISPSPASKAGCCSTSTRPVGTPEALTSESRLETVRVTWRRTRPHFYRQVFASRDNSRSTNEKQYGLFQG